MRPLNFTSALFILVSVAIISHAQLTTLNFGQSCALSGPNQNFGKELSKGILAAFKEANDADALPGLYFNLTVLDDASNEELVKNNTKDFVNNYDIIALLGQTGSQNAKAALDALNEMGAASVPFVGPQSGATFLRDSALENVINVRASFADEIGATVAYLVSKQITRISIIYSNDMVGLNFFTSLDSILNASQLILQSTGDLAAGVENAVIDVFSGHHVQALIVVASANETAQAIHYARQNYPVAASTTLFFVPSSVDSMAFNEFLFSLYNESNTNIFATQAFPTPEYSKLRIVANFSAALQTYFPEANKTAVALEGYILGRFVIEIADRVRGGFTAANFRTAIYRSQLFFLDGVVLGPMSRSVDDPCNQGAREIFLTSLASNGTWMPVPGFQFKWTDSCTSTGSTIFSSKRLTWGQTASFSGLNSQIGSQMNLGISAAFAEANRKNALPGYKFDLVTADDSYITDRTYNNTIDLINNNVFGLIGIVGTAHAASALEAMSFLGQNLPFVGAFTGSKDLRLPFKRNVVNIRASYADEVAAMVSYLSNELVSHISIFYQNDTFGYTGYVALLGALNSSGLTLESSGTFERGSFDVSTGMNNVLDNHAPEAIIIFGTYDQAALAIKYARSRNQYGLNAVYMVVSAVDIDSFVNQLQILNVNITNIYVTQVLPLPNDPTNRLVQRYLSALSIYNPDAVPSVVSFEGYLDGLLVVEASKRVASEITPASFLDALYDSRLFVIEKMDLGPFVDTGAISSRCNQGQRSVWLTKLELNGSYSLLQDKTFTWPTCLSATDDIMRPIVFGQSVPLSGSTRNLGISYRSGILAAFNRFNRNGGLDGRMVKLNSYDDAYDADRAVNNTKKLIDNGVLGLLGYVGSPTSFASIQVTQAKKIPFVAPYSGAPAFRSPCSKYVINMRSSYFDESSALVEFLLDPKHAAQRNYRTFTNIAIFYQNDTYGNYYEGTVAALNYRKMVPSGWGSYQIGTMDVQAGLDNITASGIVPDAIVVLGSSVPSAKFIKLAKEIFPPTTTYMLFSFTAPESLAADFASSGTKLYDAANNPTVYLSTVMPSPTDATHPLAAEYMGELSQMTPPGTPNFVSFEGYAVGRFVTRALQLAEGDLTYRSFTEAIYEKFMFNLDEYYLGPYTLTTTSASARNRTASTEEVLTCTCSQGSHQVWLSYISDKFNVTQVNDFEFIFDTCGVVYEVFILQQISDGVRGIILALAVLAIIIVLACAILVVAFRYTKTMVASSPVFLMIILLGALLLSISPFLAINWSGAGIVGSDHICMTWIWFLGLGFTLFFAPLAVKTYRVYRIFNNRVLSHVITLKDSDLMIYLSVPVVLEVILLIIWSAIAPAQLITARIPGTVDQTMQLCTTIDGKDQAFIITQAVFFGLIALAACFFAFRTRNIKYGAFKESSEILFAAYNLTFLSVILVPLHAGLTYYVIPSSIIRTIGVVFQVLVSLLSLFGMKLYRIITNNEHMSTTTRRSGFSSRGPFSFSSTTGTSKGKTTNTTTTTTTTTTTSSRSSGSTAASSFTSTATSTSSSSSTTMSSSEEEERQNQQKKKKAAAAAAAKPKSPAKPTSPTKPPGTAGGMNDSVMTEPSTEESSSHEQRSKKIRHDKKDGKNNNKSGQKKKNNNNTNDKKTKKDADNDDGDDDFSSSSEEEVQKKETVVKKKSKSKKNNEEELHEVVPDSTSSSSSSSDDEEDRKAKPQPRKKKSGEK